MLAGERASWVRSKRGNLMVQAAGSFTHYLASPSVATRGSQRDACSCSGLCDKQGNWSLGNCIFIASSKQACSSYQKTLPQKEKKKKDLTSSRTFAKRLRISLGECVRTLYSWHSWQDPWERSSNSPSFGEKNFKIKQVKKRNMYRKKNTFLPHYYY